MVVAWPDRGSVLLEHTESHLVAAGVDMTSAADELVLAMLAAAEGARRSAHRKIRDACLRHHSGGGSRAVTLPREQASLMFEAWYEAPRGARIGTDQVRVPLPRYRVRRDETRQWVDYDDEVSPGRLPDYILDDITRCYALDEIRCRALARGHDRHALPVSARLDGGAVMVTMADGTSRTASDWIRQCAADGLIRAQRGETDRTNL